MSKIDIDPTGRFSTALKQAIEEADLTLNELADKVDGTYENMRKLVAGKSLPSTHILPALARVLHADRKEWEELVEADRLYKKYKHLPKFLGTSKEMERFEPVIPKLSKEGQETLFKMAKKLLSEERQYA